MTDIIFLKQEQYSVRTRVTWYWLEEILNYIDEKTVRITFEAFKMNEYYCSSDNSHTEECIILTAL